MSLPEKKDLFLRELYRHKSEDEFLYIPMVIAKAHLPFCTYVSQQRLVYRLFLSGMVELITPDQPERCRITKLGIIFCECSSYAYPGRPIIVKEEQ